MPNHHVLSDKDYEKPCPICHPTQTESEFSKMDDKSNDKKDGETICRYNHQHHNHHHILRDEDYENPWPICLSGYKDEEKITMLNHQHHHHHH